MRILTSLTLSLFFVASSGINAWANTAEDVDSEAIDLLVSGQYEDAIKRFTIAISLDPKLATAYEGRAVAYSRANRWQQAIDDYTQELKLRPQHSAAYCGRAEAYESLREYQKATADFTQAIIYAPCSYYYSKRAALYEKLGEQQLAEQDKRNLKRVENAEHAVQMDRCNRSISNNPKDAEAYLSRGVTYYWMGDHAQAIDDITRALSLAKGNSAVSLGFNMSPDYALFCRGRACAALGKYEDAIKDYNDVIASGEMCILGRGLAMPPRHLPIEEHLRRGEAYFALRRWQPALQDFTNVIDSFKNKTDSKDPPNPIENNPLLAAAYHGRAQVYQREGNYDLVPEDLERAKQCGFSETNPGGAKPILSPVP